MIVFDGITVDSLSSIRRDGLWPGSFVSESRELAGGYSWLTCIASGDDFDPRQFTEG